MTQKPAGIWGQQPERPGLVVVYPIQACMKPRFIPGSKWVRDEWATKGLIVVELTLVETRAAARSLRTFEVRRAARRAECSNLVDLARRMSVTPDEAIRQLIDRNQRRAADPASQG